MNLTRRTLLLLSLSAVSGMAETKSAAFAFKDTAASHLDINRDGKTVARWMYAHDTSTKERAAETYKPFLHVFDASGTGPITKGAGGSFTHHRGVFLGWNKISLGGKTYDRWHMKGGDQVQKELIKPTAEAGKATFTSHILWAGATPEVTILDEKRTLTFFTPDTPAYLGIDMTSVVKAVAGETQLGGDPEHAGLQFRPAEEVDRAATTYIYPVKEADAHKDRDYPWVGETFTLAGKQYSVIYLNHPDNPKDTAFSAYRDYGRFGGFFKTSLAANQELTLKVRLLIVEGAMPEASVIQKASNEFTGKSDPVPTVTIKPAEGAKKPAKR